MRGVIVVAMLLAGCSPEPEPVCPEDGGTDAAPVPEVDPDCRGLTPQDLAGRPDEIAPIGGMQPWQAVRLSIDGRVAYADFVGDSGVSLGKTLIRFRIGLDDGVVTLTDHAAVDSSLVRSGRWALCRADLDADIEVHALGRGVVPPSTQLAGPLVRVVRHSTGETLFTFGLGLVPRLYNGWSGSFERDKVYLAPERASDARCCPTDTCIVESCGTNEIPLGSSCRWTNEVSTADGFCYARLVD